ncbi:MAG TPA: metallophosphoesterase family protein [Terriglobia bacterium]|nr:metallophosphoesterase family protein [Terriglobia bacterium]
MKIGLISDTYGYFDPRIPELLAGANVILHAGDVGTINVLEELALIAPVRAVKGNVDSDALGLPLSLHFALGGTRFEMQHILPISQSQIEEWSGSKQLSEAESRARKRFLARFEPSTQIVVFGHSHQPCLAQLGEKLFVNPGSAGKKRFSLPRCCGEISILNQEARVKILSLEDYNQGVPESITFKLGGSASCLH